MLAVPYTPSCRGWRWALESFTPAVSIVRILLHISSIWLLGALGAILPSMEQHGYCGSFP